MHSRHFRPRIFIVSTKNGGAFDTFFADCHLLRVSRAKNSPTLQMYTVFCWVIPKMRGVNNKWIKSYQKNDNACRISAVFLVYLSHLFILPNIPHAPIVTHSSGGGGGASPDKKVVWMILFVLATLSLGGGSSPDKKVVWISHYIWYYIVSQRYFWYTAKYEKMQGGRKNTGK